MQLADVIALVGSETLMGRELRDLLSRNSLGADLTLISGNSEAAGILSEQGGEAAVLLKLEQSSVEDADTVVLAGDAESSRIALGLAAGKPVIDLTHAAEDNPLSRLRAPLVEPYGFAVPPDAIHSVAHPAAIAIALLMGRLEQGRQIARWIVQVFEPASERGSAGIQELQQQTISLLSFKPMEKKVFDAQLAFNLLASLGEDAPAPLEVSESRLERHLATLLGNAELSPMPSIRLLQAPVFHGHSFSVWVEFEGAPPDVEELHRTLGDADVNVYGNDVEPPNNAGVAGENGISVGAIERDRNNPRALWMWMVVDNLRLAAQNAMRVVQEIL